MGERVRGMGAKDRNGEGRVNALPAARAAWSGRRGLPGTRNIFLGGRRERCGRRGQDGAGGARGRQEMFMRADRRWAKQGRTRGGVRERPQVRDSG